MHTLSLLNVPDVIVPAGCHSTGLSSVERLLVLIMEWRIASWTLEVTHG